MFTPLVSASEEILLPSSYDSVFIAVGAFILITATVVAILEWKLSHSWKNSVLWFFVNLILPIIGTLLWGFYNILKMNKSQR